ncbi:MAG: hypothetical protein ABH871_02125 [Pseudomonadota bacterium]
MGERIKLLEAYFNQDQFLDRVTGSNCRVAKDESEKFIETHLVCEDYQIELGTGKKDEYIPAFKSPIKANRKKPQPGDRVFSSPELYLDGITADEGLGNPLSRQNKLDPMAPYIVRSAQIIKPLTSDKLRDLCLERHSEKKPKTFDDIDDLASCLRSARENPLDHIWQPQPEDPKLVHFENDEYDAIDPRYVVSGSPGLINPEAYKLLKQRPQPPAIIETTLSDDDSSSNTAPLLPVASPDVLIHRLRDLGVEKRGILFGKLLDSPDSAIHDIKEDDRAKAIASIETRAEEYIGLLRTSLKNFPEDAPKALVSLIDLMLENKGLNRVFDSNTITAVGKLLNERLKDPNTLKPLVEYVVENSKTKNWKWAWRQRLDLLVPMMHNLLLATNDADKIPSIAHLAMLEKELPDLRGPVMVAAAHSKDLAPADINWIKETFSKLAKSPITKDRMYVAVAAPLVLKEKAVLFLLRLIEDNAAYFEIKPGTDAVTGLPGMIAVDPMEEVHLAAYQALRPLIKPWLMSAPNETFRTFNEKEVKKAYRKGLDSLSPMVQLLCAKTLVEIGDPQVASILYKKLKDYVDDPFYSDGKKVVAAILDDSIMISAYAQKKHTVETPVEFEIPQNNAKATVTLKSLALFSIAKFGKPQESLPMLQKLLVEEKNETDLLLTAQALTALGGRSAVPLLFERLKQPAPASLFEYTIMAVKMLNVKKAAPIVYQFLVHKDLSVRRAALFTLKSFDSETMLEALIRDSKLENTNTRMLMTVYLGTYDDARAAKRLLELAKDPIQRVRDQAVNSLSLMKNQEAKKLIASTAEKDPELKTRLAPIIAG